MSNPSPIKASKFILPRTDPTTGQAFVQSHDTFRVMTDRIGDSVKITWKRVWPGTPQRIEYVLNVTYMKRVNPEVEFIDDIPEGYWSW
jgi:hypothetical protein